MTRIGIIVTHPGFYSREDPDHDTAALLPALRERGAEAEALVWHDPAVAWESYDLLVLRSPWDYVLRPADFRAWLDRIEAAGVPLLNEPALIRWNMDKIYLEQLAEAGVAVVPTTYLREASGIAAALSSADAEHVVVKPSVSAGSQRTGLFAADDPAAAQLARAIVEAGDTAMIQPEVPELSAGAEKALYLVDGRFTHAIAKGALLARGGGMIGGVYQERPEPVEASAEEIAVAEQVLAAVVAVTGAAMPLYARIDTVRSARYGLVLLEAELFEPALNLHVAPQVTATVAEAILGRAEDPARP
ncbi:ATP-grasp domain-containing protein [Brachybacterium phenoliresistens]|uniref:ATP-grasp domain-containing protein n=1 Tax=Brachybacterium phenoliresistens TaxID=396014 RepID=Z9JQR7_9MICO|nr:hypothetical protein [Brachybacterium phenoliresistens]EWS80077.1 hypothetical protein BF93_05135 [Brachybacterium phenoliresistens]